MATVFIKNIDTLIDILDKIKKSSSATVVEIHTDENFGEPVVYGITSVSATSDGYVIINVEK